jgi:hypothetical protein
MSEPAQEALAAMFLDLSQHFRGLARGRVAPLGYNLLKKIDIAINEVAACTAATHTCVAAIVGLRRSLYPDVPPYQPAQITPAALQTASSETASVTRWGTP